MTVSPVLLTQYRAALEEAVIGSAFSQKGYQQGAEAPHVAPPTQRTGGVSWIVKPSRPRSAASSTQRDGRVDTRFGRPSARRPIQITQPGQDTFTGGLLACAIRCAPPRLELALDLFVSRPRGRRLQGLRDAPHKRLEVRSPGRLVVHRCRWSTENEDVVPPVHTPIALGTELRDPAVHRRRPVGRARCRSRWPR